MDNCRAKQVFIFHKCDGKASFISYSNYIIFITIYSRNCFFEKSHAFSFCSLFKITVYDQMKWFLITHHKWCIFDISSIKIPNRMVWTNIIECCSFFSNTVIDKCRIFLSTISKLIFKISQHFEHLFASICVPLN